MKILKKVIISAIISSMILLTIVLLLPKCFYSKIGTVSSGNEDGQEYIEVSNFADISFEAKQRYIDTIEMYLCSFDENTNMLFEITDLNGKTIYNSIQNVNSNSYIVLPVKRYFRISKPYTLHIENLSDCKIKIKTVVGSGPIEEQALFADGSEADNLLYMNFMYGIYSKKFIVFMWLTFALGGYVVAESIENSFISIEKHKNK